jgi:hypothetical protein
VSGFRLAPSSERATSSAMPRLPVLLLALSVGGCSFTSSVDLRVPRVGEPTDPNVASMPTLGSELFGLHDGALTSRASLVRLDEEATCVDIVLRHPAGEPLGHIELFAEVDGAEAASFDTNLAECASGAECLPPGSPLEPFTGEDDNRITVEAQRVCLAKLPRARRELAIGRGGAFAWKFKFRFSDGA